MAYTGYFSSFEATVEQVAIGDGTHLAIVDVGAQGSAPDSHVSVQYVVGWPLRPRQRQRIEKRSAESVQPWTVAGASGKEVQAGAVSA